MEIKVGRPPLKLKSIKKMVHKLEPLLKSGLSIRKACDIAQIPRSTFNKYYAENEWFMYQIESFRAYQATVVCGAIAWRLERIRKKIRNCEEKEQEMVGFNYVEIKKEVEKIEPTRDDWRFVEWIATHSTALRDEYGNRSKVIVESSSSEDDSLSEEKAQEIVETLENQMKITRLNQKNSNSDSLTLSA